MMRLLGLSACALLMLVVPSVSMAQNCTASGIPSSCSASRNMRITVRRTASLTVTPAELSLGSPNADEFESEFMDRTGHTLTVRANNSWRLQIRVSQGNWSATGGARPDKPRADLLWAVTPGGSYTAVSNSSTDFASGSATSGSSVTLYYRVLWSWALDRPGTYSLPVQITLSAP